MFTVDTDRIQAAASDMSGIAGEIESSVSAMHARLTSLEGSWTGAGRDRVPGPGQRVDRVAGSGPRRPRPDRRAHLTGKRQLRGDRTRRAGLVRALSAGRRVTARTGRRRRLPGARSRLGVGGEAEAPSSGGTRGHYGSLWGAHQRHRPRCHRFEPSVQDGRHRNNVARLRTAGRFRRPSGRSGNAGRSRGGRPPAGSQKGPPSGASCCSGRSVGLRSPCRPYRRRHPAWPERPSRACRR